MEDVASRLNFAEMRGRRGILQLRWATFGAPSQINAQPHLDSDGDLVGAHNGNVVNNVELRRQFMDEGLIVRSLSGDRIALCPPLIITEEEIGELFDRLTRALDRTAEWIGKEGLMAA